MPKLRLRDPDYVLIADALDLYKHEARNHVCADYAESHGIDAMREWEKRAQHCINLLERIRKARLP